MQANFQKSMFRNDLPDLSASFRSFRRLEPSSRRLTLCSDRSAQSFESTSANLKAISKAKSKLAQKLGFNTVDSACRSVELPQVTVGLKSKFEVEYNENKFARISKPEN
jgi:hypothetical protein